MASRRSASLLARPGAIDGLDVASGQSVVGGRIDSDSPRGASGSIGVARIEAMSADLETLGADPGAAAAAAAAGVNPQSALTAMSARLSDVVAEQGAANDVARRAA